MPTDTLLAELLRAVEQELPRAVELRRRLHAEPELAHREQLTSAAVTAELPVACEALAGTGLLARVAGGESDGAPDAQGAPAVVVRAELDGLPVRERTGVSFSARGETMHACGHDVHMAALVALTRAAHGLRERLPTPLLAMFQPSEEAYPSGAQMIVGEGALEDQHVGAMVAAHVHPELRWDSVAIDAGVVNASFDRVQITIEGQPTHGAYPHRGRDPVLALSETIVALHARLGRLIDPLHPATVTIGKVQAGSAENVIPAQARAWGALRAHRREDRLALREMAIEVVAGVARAHGCVGRVELTPGEPPLENDIAIVARARELLGGAELSPADEWRSCGSDDFAYFGERVPVAMAFVGLAGAPGFQTRPLHHPELLVPDEAVGKVAGTQAVMYLAAASSMNRERR